MNSSAPPAATGGQRPALMLLKPQVPMTFSDTLKGGSIGFHRPPPSGGTYLLDLTTQLQEGTSGKQPPADQPKLVHFPDDLEEEGVAEEEAERGGEGLSAFVGQKVEGRTQYKNATIRDCFTYTIKRCV